MSKKRVYEIARERGLTTQQVLKRLEQEGVAVKAAASTVSAEDEERVFGAPKTRETASPSAGKALPSWLSPSAASGPRTTSKAALDAEREARNAKAEAAKSAKAKAVEQARALRAQLAAKKAQQEAAAGAAHELQKATEEATAAVDMPSAAAPAVESPAAEAPAAEVEAPADAPVVDSPATDVDAGTSAADVAAESPAAADEDEASVDTRVGPRIVSRAPEEEAAPPAAPAAAAPLPASEQAAKEADERNVSDAELRRQAQKLAQQRVGELAARRRAELEREKLEEEQRKREEERGEKKRDKKKKEEEEAAKKDEFVGSRKPRVGGASRDADTGSRRGPSKRRRVVIDSGAGRGRGGQGGGRGRGGRGKHRQRQEEVVIDPTVPVTVNAGVSVKELADALHVTSTDIIRALMEGGEMVTITQTLMVEQIETVGIALDPPREIIVKSAADDDVIPVFEDSDEELLTRAPVVTIMGHVDHGKTSLLDAIRETKVAAGEAGGITQHIGAYQVEVPHEGGTRKVTFLDTPGHEAFTALRARGAKVTDEAVLVVAADDGVKPQTIEAIDHARAADVPIIVAINKIDKDNAQPEKVKSELAQHELQPVDWGGDTEVIEVSAKQRTNLDDLIELILLQADVLELKANPNAEASGYIIESKLDPGRGPVATMLVSRGTLKVGDAVVAGSSHGKVRALHDFRGDRVQDAGPAVPVEIIGFDSVPDAGEFCMVVDNERVARDKAQKRGFRLKAELLAKRQRGLTLQGLFDRIKDGEVQDLNLIVKSDVAGSIEAIEQELGKIEHEEVRVRIIRSGVGGITGSDVMLAAASSAIIVGFNVRPNAEAKVSAEREGVDIKTYKVIYKLREDIELALSGMLSPEEVEKTTGEAEVRQVFRASRIGTIAGCMVTSGTIERNAKVRLIRNGAVVFEGEIGSLKRHKDDAKEVAQGFECGISIENFNDIKEGDVIETYVIEEVERDITSELASKA